MLARRVLLLSVFFVACADAGPDPAADASLPDGGSVAPDAGSDAGPAPYPPLAPEAALEPEPIPVWMLGVVTDQVRSAHDGEDPVLDEIRSGTFTCPEVGPADNGVRWRPQVPEDSGAVDIPSTAGSGVLYIVACIQSAAPRGLVAQADAFGSVFANGAEQPGDFYASRQLRLPVTLRAGENLVVARGSTDGRQPTLRLWRTPHELVFNPEDVTAPTIVVGEPLSAPLGVPVLNLGTTPALGLRAHVEESDLFEATVREQVGLPGGAVTQVAFDLVLKAPLTETATRAPVPVHLRIESRDLEWSYAGEVELEARPRSRNYAATFYSDIDRSVQYYGVRSPEVLEPGREHALILSLHGAGVQALNQAGSYGAKDWAIVLAATNRRRFGFDWEDWGRLDALEVLAAGKQAFAHDPTQVYLSGHSMGGHGTWHVGLSTPTEFAVIGPSAGWSHFDVYGGARSPPPGPGLAGAFAAAQQHSQTPTFLENAARRAVYILHGDADDNVPVSQARTMRDALAPICEDLHYHEEPGAGHWWDGYPEPGAQCVDWPEMMDLMQDRRLDPNELEFDFVSAGAWYSPRHAFVRLLSSHDPYAPLRVSSRIDGDRVVLTSSNARSLELDGDALLAAGVASVEVDGEVRAVSQGRLHFGPETGKRPGQHGPLKEAFFSPFLFVYPDASEVYRQLAAYYTTYWSFIGNGHAPAVPLSKLTDALRAEHDVIYLGVEPDGYADTSRLAIEPAADGILVGEDRYPNAATIFVFPEGERLSAVFYATPGDERLLFGFAPFRSGFGLPDYLVFTYGGSQTGGFFDAEWGLDPALRR